MWKRLCVADRPWKGPCVHALGDPLPLHVEGTCDLLQINRIRRWWRASVPAMILCYRRFCLSQWQWEILLVQLVEKLARLIKLTLQGTAGRPGTRGRPLGPNGGLQLTLCWRPISTRGRLRTALCPQPKWAGKETLFRGSLQVRMKPRRHLHCHPRPEQGTRQVLPRLLTHGHGEIINVCVCVFEALNLL